MSMYSYLSNQAETPAPSEPLTLYGLGMNAAQFRAEQTKGRATGWIPFAIALLFGILAYEAVGLAGMYVGVNEARVVFALMLVAAAAGAAGVTLYRGERARREEQAWRVYEIETAGGLTTTLYDDHVEQASARWREHLPLAGAVFTEKPTLLILENAGRRVVWRAEDLTPEQAWVLIMRLRGAIPRENQFATGVFQPGRQVVCPPPFSNCPPVCYDRFSYMPERAPTATLLPAGSPMMVAAVCMVTAAIFAALFTMTGSFLVDYLLFFVAFFAGAGAVMLLIGRRLGASLAKKAAAAGEITLSFTGDGLLIEQAGGQRFVAARDAHAERTAYGALLHTPAGIFAFPWNATHNRHQLEWMLFGQ